uniref:Uncharacterized protein n=1 Tax=Sphaerodactylus townsendi TaxID=933632 RepID=A0ACB8E9L7_9SAUR
MVRCCMRAVTSLCPNRVFTRLGKQCTVLPTFSNLLISDRPYSAKKQSSKTKPKSGTKGKTSEPEPVRKRKRFKPVLLSEPTDDVYLTWYYQRPIYEAEVAVDMLKKFQELDFTYPRQHVYADITLDMSMGKKKPLEPFEATVLLPHRFVDDFHKVVAFTENAEEAALAKENGAAFAGGFELVKSILDGEIQADYYVAVPAMLNKINSLRTVLNDKHPRAKNGSVSYDIPKMLSFFRACHTYKVEADHRVQSPIATLDMPTDHIVADKLAILKGCVWLQSLAYGSFVTRLFIRSSTSEGLQLKFERFVPQPASKEKAEEKVTEGDADTDDEEMQEAK